MPKISARLEAHEIWLECDLSQAWDVDAPKPKWHFSIRSELAIRKPATEMATSKTSKPAKPKRSKPAKAAQRSKIAARKTGRPSGYSDERVVPFLQAIAEAKSTKQAAEVIGVTATCIFEWLKKHKDFAERYARAKEAAADHIVEEMIEIVDDGANDYVQGKNGPILNAEAIARSRLRFDARKWIAAKLRPHKYGDVIDVNHGVQPSNPLINLIKEVQGTSLKPSPGQSLDHLDDGGDK